MKTYKIFVNTTIEILENTLLMQITMRLSGFELLYKSKFAKNSLNEVKFSVFFSIFPYFASHFCCVCTVSFRKKIDSLRNMRSAKQ